MIIDLLTDEPCFYGNEKACRNYAEYWNSRAMYERYVAARFNDYMIAVQQEGKQKNEL